MILSTKIPMRNIVNTILRQRWVWIIIPGLLLGCDLISSDNRSTMNDLDGVAVPQAIFDSNLEGNTYARLYMDSGTTPLREQIVATDGTLNSDDTVTFNGVGVPAGSHTFTIKFEYVPIGSDVSIVLATATTPTVDLAPGSKTTLSEYFTAGNYSFIDSDEDQVSNLKELIAGSPIDDDVCVIGVSLIGHCALGI